MNQLRVLALVWIGGILQTGCSGQIEKPINGGTATVAPAQSPPPAAAVETSTNSATPESISSKAEQTEEVRIRDLTLPGDVKLRLIWCPEGSFTMGSPKSEPQREDGEDQISVTLTHGFWLGETEVTQSQWQAVMGTKPWEEHKPYNPKAGPSHRVGSDYPASHMFHRQAAEFCAAIDKLQREAGQVEEGWAYTLPTEAQWEYACRAGTTTTYSFGESPKGINDYAWVDLSSQKPVEKYPHLVKTKRPNPWGLYDMHGNVWEWCSDRWHFSAAELQGGNDPQGASVGDSHICRGGSWFVDAKFVRSALRKTDDAEWRQDDHGLRLAMTYTIPPSQKP